MTTNPIDEEFMKGLSESFQKAQERAQQPPTEHQLEQEQRRQADIAEYGNEQEFTYKKIRCYMLRRYGKYWCGYLDCGIVEDVFNRLNGVAHGGMTAHNGFDCAHLGDYPVDPDGEYRDYAYVRKVLEDLVDELVV